MRARAIFVPKKSLLMNLRYALIISGIAITLTACTSEQRGKSRGPIVLGDSSTIITERNTALLQDQVPDLKQIERSSEESAPAMNSDTVQVRQATTPPVQASAMSGLVVPFREVTLNIPGIAVREQRKDLGVARGASFTLSNGNLAGTALTITGGTPTKVSQRYTTMLLLDDDGDKLALENITNTTGWQTLQGNGGSYALNSLAAKGGFQYPKPAAIRSAVQQAARRKRLNRKDTQDWLDFVSDSHYTQTSGMQLKNVVWRIEGKDATGKSFSKELRVDVPLQ